MFVQESNQRSDAFRLDALMDDRNTMQPGGSSVLAVESEPRQFFHKLFGEDVIQECESLSEGEAKRFRNKAGRYDKTFILY